MKPKVEKKKKAELKLENNSKPQEKIEMTICNPSWTDV